MAKDSLYRDRNLQVIFGVTLMAVLGVTSITPAFPSIMRELGITGSQVGLLITSFTLPGVILAPFLGVLADRFGRKKILVPSLFLFAIAGTAEQLPDLAVPNGFELVVRGKPGNTGDIYLGNSKVNAEDVNERLPYSKGNGLTLKVTNANLVWVDAAVPGEGVDYWVET